MRAPQVALSLVVVVAAGCGAGASTPPVSQPTVPSAPAAATPGASPTSAASTVASATATNAASGAACATGPFPTPNVYANYQKLSEGAHGGPPLLDLPGCVDVDYQLFGACSFDLTVSDEAGTAGLPAFHLDVAKPGISGTWSFAVAPGSYYVTPGEAVGCTYTVTVRAAT